MRKLLLALGFAAMANSAMAADITISDAWSREMASDTAVVYFTVTDTGAPDKLIGAETSVAAKAELHQTTKTDGIMKMAPVTSVDIDSSHPFKATPNGYHLMLRNVKPALRAGNSFPLTLIFAKAGKISTDVIVKPAASANTNAMGGMKMDGMGMAH